MTLTRFSLYFSVLFLIGCNWYSNCPVLDLTKEDLSWLDRYNVGDTIILESNKKNRDTLIVTDRTISYSPCNKFELGPYQLQRVMVIFLVKGKEKNTEDVQIHMYSEKIDAFSSRMKIWFSGFEYNAYFVIMSLKIFQGAEKYYEKKFTFQLFIEKLMRLRLTVLMRIRMVINYFLFIGARSTGCYAMKHMTVRFLS